MAPAALTSDEQMAAMEVILFRLGAITLSKFTAFFKDVDEVRAVAKGSTFLPEVSLLPV